MSDNRVKRVAFIDQKLLNAFNELKSGRFEDKELAKQIDEAMDELKGNPFVGSKVERKLWPKEYVKRYGIDNLRRYGLRNGWRLMYTISGDQVEVVSILLEWLDHKNYERRFGYKSR
jgi:Txe/YoeB family toxin of Txe-Axe toxin-antitoxin module